MLQFQRLCGLINDNAMLKMFDSLTIISGGVHAQVTLKDNNYFGA